MLMDKAGYKILNATKLGFFQYAQKIISSMCGWWADFSSLFFYIFYKEYVYITSMFYFYSIKKGISEIFFLTLQSL